MMVGPVDSSHIACCGEGRRQLAADRPTLWIRKIWLAVPCHSCRLRAVCSVVMVTQSILTDASRTIPGSDDGAMVPQTDTSSWGQWRWSPSIVYGWVPVLAHVSMLFTSVDRVSTLLAGTTRCRRRTWPGGFRVSLLLRSPALMTYESWPLYDAGSDGHQCWRMSMIDGAVWVTSKEINQLVVSFVWNVHLGQILQEGGVTHRAPFQTSNFVLKSSDMTMTRFRRRLLVTWLSRVIIAATGDPVDLTANWSENDDDGGGDRKAE